MKRLFAVTIFLCLVGIGAVAQGLPQAAPEYENVLNKVLESLYTVAHWIGQVITGVIQSLIPTVKIPDSLVDAIGFLALLTVFLVVAEVAKRLAWIVVLVGWVLIVIRIVMAVV